MGVLRTDLAQLDPSKDTIDDLINKISDNFEYLATGGESRFVDLEKVCIYYGYPVGINNTWTVDGAVDVYKSYDLVVLGDTYELPDQEVYAETCEIIRRLAEVSTSTRVAGYVPIGVYQVGEDSGLSMDELKRRVLLWKEIGAKGIFLDEFGYDYGVSRERQNEIVTYVHDQGMFVIANSWNQSYVFSSLPMSMEGYDLPSDFSPNPKGLEPVLNNKDYSLLENFFYSCERSVTNPEDVTLKGASCWRVDDGYAYYSRTQDEYGKTYYQKFGTKLLQLDAIPHSLSATEKNTLMTLSIFGAKVFNIPAIAFGDEDWGASGYYYSWDIPSAVDLTEDLSLGLHSVEVGTKGEEENNFPYKWSASVNGNIISIIFDVENGEDETWDDDKRYVTVNDVRVNNAWQSIYEFGESVRKAVKTTDEVKKIVEDALPTVSDAESRLKTALDNVDTTLSKATNEVRTTIDSALADVAGVTSGFGFKEVQW